MKSMEVVAAVVKELSSRGFDCEVSGKDVISADPELIIRCGCGFRSGSDLILDACEDYMEKNPDVKHLPVISSAVGSSSGKVSVTCSLEILVNGAALALGYDRAGEIIPDSEEEHALEAYAEIDVEMSLRDYVSHLVASCPSNKEVDG